MKEKNEPATTTLRFGHFGCAKHEWTVLAKDYHGESVPIIYANRTQARRKANELGSAWAVKQGPQSRRFYVVRVNNPNINYMAYHGAEARAA